jgi:hypothetical protein
MVYASGAHGVYISEELGEATMRLKRQEVFLVAATAGVDPRSVWKYLDKDTLRGMTGIKIQRAMRALGFEHDPSDPSGQTPGISGGISGGISVVAASAADDPSGSAGPSGAKSSA